MLAEVREGLGVVLGSPYLRNIAGATGTSNFFASALFSIFILFATRDLAMKPAAIGLVGSTGSLGALPASGHRRDRDRRDPVVSAGAVLPRANPAGDSGTC